MSTSSIHFSEKSEYNEQLKLSEFERFQKGMKADFSKLIDEVEHFPQQNPASSRNNKPQAETRQSENPSNSDQLEEDDQTHDVWTVASSRETGVPHPDLDGISFHSDIDIYGDLVDNEHRSSSDSWERHLDDVDDDYKLRPPRKKTSGSVISVQSVGDYFLSKSFPVSDFDDVMNSQKSPGSNVSIEGLSAKDIQEKTSFQSLLHSRFSLLPNKLNQKTEYIIQETHLMYEDKHTSMSQHDDDAISTPENISISEALSSSSQQESQARKEFRYAISPESFLFECRYREGKLSSKKLHLTIYNPSPDISITYRLDSPNDFLLFSSLSGSIHEQSQAILSVRLNIDTIKQQSLEKGTPSLSDKLFVFIDDMPPSELEVMVNLDLDMDIELSDKRIRNSDFKYEQQYHESTSYSCCKFCNIEKNTELYIH